MELNFDFCYQALLSHDPRFDGVFFVGVSSTHIYCRTVCPAKTPFAKNCTFFSSAAAAERAGYRPCMRCRPELAPGTSKVDSVGRLASAVAQRIEDGALYDMSAAQLAQEIGISERHLRRVVEQEFGVSPLDLAQTQRLLLAKRLLTDTRLPVTEVAFISGFSSLRRFNAIFRERYNLTPSQLRNGRHLRMDSDVVECALSYRPPLDWISLVRFLSSRTATGAEAFTDGKYVRSVAIGNTHGWIEVSPTIGSNSKAGQVEEGDSPSPEKGAGASIKALGKKHRTLNIRMSMSLSRSMVPILAKVRRLFDLDADPHTVSEHLGKLASNNPGLRVPGAFDSFELVVRAILGQQVSVKGATTLMGRFVTAFGEPVETPFEAIRFITPTPLAIASQSTENIATVIKIPLARARAIHAVAQGFSDGTLVLDRAVHIEEIIEQLMQLPGVGPWTAQYIAMRALRWPDAFPHGDLGIRKALQENVSNNVLAVAEQWRPWRAYAAMHLWKSLED
jgi:AraC family transcriptional regulator of adaptative response / DNA-3-methyladenine glycosylase II